MINKCDSFCFCKKEREKEKNIYLLHPTIALSAQDRKFEKQCNILLWTWEKNQSKTKTKITFSTEYITNIQLYNCTTVFLPDVVFSRAEIAPCKN